jgi:S1/P1 Nuclease
LARADGDVRKRQKALKYLIHFVGDLHPPLHTGDKGDRGGNDVQVEFLGQAVNPYSHKPWNLHAVWDSGIFEAHDRDAHHYAQQLSIWLNSHPEGTIQDGSVVDWAMESHRIAKEHVYVLPDSRKLGKTITRRIYP